MLWRLIKLLLVLAFLAGLAFIAFAYLGPIFLVDDFAPPIGEVTEPVTLQAQ